MFTKDKIYHHKTAVKWLQFFSPSCVRLPTCVFASKCEPVSSSCFQSLRVIFSRLVAISILYYCLSTHTIWAILQFDWFPRPILSANITFPQCYGTLSRPVAVKVRSNLQSWFQNFLLTLFACFQAIFCAVQTLMYQLGWMFMRDEW